MLYCLNSESILVNCKLSLTYNNDHLCRYKLYNDFFKYIVKISAAPDCSIPVAAGVSAAVVVIVSVVSSLITFCITYLIMRKNGQASPVYKVLDNVE